MPDIQKIDVPCLVHTTRFKQCKNNVNLFTSIGALSCQIKKKVYMYYVLYITSYDTCILLRMEIKQANINHALNIKTIPIKKTTIKNTNQTKLKILSLIFFWQILNFLIQLYFYHFISFRMKMSSENSFVKPVCNIFFLIFI